MDALADNHQLAPVGKYFSYNNSAFIAAGRVIEVVTDQTYLEALTEHVLEPLELERTFLYPEQVMTEAFAVGHTQASGVFAGDLIVAEPWALPRMAAPAGSHIASIKELMRYARFHLGEGTNAAGDVVLTPETMSAFRIATLAGGALGANVIGGVAVAWLLGDVAGTRVQMHGGSTNGQESLLILVPERNFAIGLLTNASAGADLNTTVSSWALERFLGLAVPRPTPLATPGLDLGQYVGRYRDGSGGPTIVIGEDEGALTGALQVVGMGELPTDAPLVFVGKDLVQFSLGGQPLLADFVRTESGEVGWLRFGGRLQPRLAD